MEGKFEPPKPPEFCEKCGGIMEVISRTIGNYPENAALNPMPKEIAENDGLKIDLLTCPKCKHRETRRYA